MFTLWSETDSDCCQHMRKDGSLYEMIQFVWLDLTEEDRQSGCYEYYIIRKQISLNDYSIDEMKDYIYLYGYTMEDLQEQYGDAALDIVAECILEEEIINDDYVIGKAHSFEEAKKKIEKFIKEEQK